MTASLVGLATLSVSLVTETAFALVEELSVNDLTMQSDTIVVGTVSKVDSFWLDQRIYTDVSISVDQIVKGDPLPAEITVRQPGGRVGDIWEWVEDTPGFAPGERTVLFLTSKGGTRFDTVGAFQGKVPVENDQAFIEGRYVPLSSLLGRVSAILEGREQAPAEVEPEGGAAPAAACSIGGINPPSASAGTGSKVNISGDNFDSAGTVTFYDPGGSLTPAPYGTWTANLIKDVVVPIVSHVASGYSTLRSSSSGPVTITPQNNPACTSAFDFQVTFGYSGYRWQGTPHKVTYFINPNTGDTDGERAAAWAGANTWNGQAGFSFAEGGTTTSTTASLNWSNEVMWRLGMTTGTLAATTIWSLGSSIVECDIEFNDDYSWYANGSPPSGTYDVQSVAVHEFGHCLDLLDLYGAGAVYDKAKIMYGIGVDGATHRNLHADDKAGIQWIYPRGVGGIAEAPDVDASPLEGTASGGSSSAPYAAIAGAAGGALLLAAGAWYARRRWRAG